MLSFFMPDRTEPFARLRYANLLLFGLMPAALLLARGAAEVIMAVIGLSFLWVTIAERRWNNLTERTIAILLVTWLLLNLVISPLALEPMVSYSRSLLWLRFVIFFAAASTWLLRSRKDLRILLVLWSVTLALAMLDGYVQFATGTSLSGNVMQTARLTGPLDRPNIGIFTARIGFPLLGMAFLLVGSRRLQTGRLLAITGFAVIAFVFIILTGERTAAVLTMMSVIAGAAIVVLLVPGWRLYGFMLAAAVPAGLLGLFALSRDVQIRVSQFWQDVSHFWSSPYGKIYHAAFEIWKHNPVTGAGLKGFQNACETQLPSAMDGACYPHAHNIYLEWLSESGLLGLACFLLFVAVLAFLVLRLVMTRPDRRLIGAALCGGLIVTLFPVAATQSFFSNWPAMLAWTTLSAVAGITHIAQKDAPDRPA